METRSGPHATTPIIYLICVAIILLPASIFSIVIASNVRKFREMLIKRNVFILHIMICYFILTLFELFEAIRLHTDVLDPRRASYWFIYPILVSFVAAKYLIVFCFFFHHIYDNVNQKSLKYTLRGILCFALFYVIVLGILIITLRHKLGMSLIYGPAYFNLVLLVSILTIYLLLTVVLVFNKSRGGEITEEIKIRFAVSFIALSCSLLHHIIDFTIPIVWPYITVYLVDCLEVFAIGIFLILYDVNFKYALLKCFCSDNDYHIEYDGVEQYDVRT